MSVRIYFNFDSPLFREPLCVPLDWTFPFFPRVGEAISGWVWIQQGKWEQSEVEKELSEEGKKSWESHRSRDFEFEDWLFEMAMECNRVFDVCFTRRHDMPAGEIHLEMWLNDDGKMK